MNDCKELIEELEFLSKHVPEQMCDENGEDALMKAVNAIKELERKLYNANGEIKQLKQVLKNEGVVVLPPRIFGNKSRWNI